MFKWMKKKEAVKENPVEAAMKEFHPRMFDGEYLYDRKEEIKDLVEKYLAPLQIELNRMGVSYLLAIEASRESRRGHSHFTVAAATGAATHRCLAAAATLFGTGAAGNELANMVLEISNQAHKAAVYAAIQEGENQPRH